MQTRDRDMPVQLQQVADAVLALYDLAALTARNAVRPVRRPARHRRYTTLTPGAGTPLWNELVKQAQPHLARRGSKIRLARYLGLPRQRLQVCLKSQSGCMDAERTLLLLCWVVARQQGRELDL
ncbi:MAG: hypothetical protein JSS11_16190 [Verrucomicrobia bacterium]|nr:hypothetical protein [Verrucomicrobiota bacterium]